MLRCYLLAMCSGASLDQHSNNVSLFNLVEQINVPAGASPPPGGTLPLEIHAYLLVDGDDLGTSFEMRFALRADSGLETYSDIFKHRSVTARYRTRTLGLPAPPVLGSYELRLDLRREGTGEWQRSSAAWPLLVVEAPEQTPAVH